MFLIGFFSLTLVIHCKNFISSLFNDTKILNHVGFSNSMRPDDFLNLFGIASNSIENRFNTNL